MRITSAKIELVNDGDIAQLLGGSPLDNFAATSARISILQGTGAFRLDGVTPANLAGHPVASQDEIEFDSCEEVQGFRIVQIGTTALILFVTYFFENSK